MSTPVNGKYSYEATAKKFANNKLCTYFYREIGDGLLVN